MSVGKNIKKYRKQKGMTQKELADAIGVSVQAISKWECGATPDITQILPLAAALGASANELLGYADPLYRTPWPTYDESALQASEVEYGIQINGKVRTRIALPADLDKAAVEQAALAAGAVQPFLAGKTVRKVIVVKNIVNIVVA